VFDTSFASDDEHPATATRLSDADEARASKR